MYLLSVSYCHHYYYLYCSNVANSILPNSKPNKRNRLLVKPVRNGTRIEAKFWEKKKIRIRKGTIPLQQFALFASLSLSISPFSRYVCVNWLDFVTCLDFVYQVAVNCEASNSLRVASSLRLICSAIPFRGNLLSRAPCLLLHVQANSALPISP